MNAETHSNVRADAASRAGRQAGFTLVEIMVVIVILGLLATLVTQNIIGASDEAKISKAQTDLKTIHGAVTMYRVKTGKLPESVQVLAEPDENGNKYIDELSDDPWGNPYEIREGDTPREFEVISFGPDGSEGTEDDVSSRSKKDD